MLSGIRRPLLVILWIILAFALGLSLAIGLLEAIQIFDPSLMTWILKRVSDVILYPAVFLSGPSITMIIAAYLGLKGVLPGTRKGSRKDHLPSAFPVIQPPGPQGN